MATEKIGIYRRWLEPAPVINGVPVPESDWPQKRRHNWVVRWFGTKGKRYSKTFKTKKLANQFSRQLQEQVNRGIQDTPEKIYLHAFIKEHEKIMQGQVAYATIFEQMNALRLFENFIGKKIFLADIKPRDAEAFISKRLSSGITSATANKDIRTLRRVFNLAIEPRGYLKKGQNPFAKIKQRKISLKPVNYLAVQDYKNLQETADSLWWKAFISVAYCCGLRRSEILNLIWNDIDFERQYIHVTPKSDSEETIQWEPKDHECRIIPMPSETTQLLVNLQIESPVSFPYVFIPPKRFERIKKRIIAGTWNSRCRILNNLLKNFNNSGFNS